VDISKKGIKVIRKLISLPGKFNLNLIFFDR